MTKGQKKRPDDYAEEMIEALWSGEPDAVDRAILFLEGRLTPAAIGGCHHCDEGDKGSPCWWCGLKNRGKRGR